MSELLNVFAGRFHDCNPDVLERGEHLQLCSVYHIVFLIHCISTVLVDIIYLLSFSLLLLSTDQHSPHVRNKMSKREFVRNSRAWVRDDELLGHMYDNIWLYGHVAKNYN